MGASDNSNVVFRVGAIATGASILGIRRFNMARRDLIQRAPIAGRIVDVAIVAAVSGIEPGATIAAQACRDAATLSPAPVGEAWRRAGDVAATVGRVVRLTGLDQSAANTAPPSP